MISVGRNDGRKGLGLGFGIGGEMEETEVEEGEACYYQNDYDDDDDSPIDPDVALSYIDEKLQDVLGHFQKDFEGGVSAENLGAKFGGYGSFLPTYQRSPPWSHQRTPPKICKHLTPRSPHNLHLEGGHHSSAVASTVSLSAIHVPSAITAVSFPAVKASSVHDSVKRDVCMSSTHAEEFTPACELTNRSANSSDQKTLKVRIKVGSDNLSTRKKAEIYSGLGLDVSPSSSLDNSPTDSEGLCLDFQDISDESPVSILQMMASFPVLGSLLLSPLPNELIHSVEKEKLQDSSRSRVHKGSQESSVIFMNGSDSARGGREILREKKPKPSEKYAIPVILKNDSGNDGQNGNNVLLQKEADIDSSTCEELVSNALKLPLLSNTYCSVVKSAKGTTEAVDITKLTNKGGASDECSPDLAKEEPLDTLFTQANIRVGRIGSDGNVWDGEKTEFREKGDSSISKGRKALHAELKDPQKQKSGQKATSREEDDMKMVPQKELPASGSKRKKSKGSRSHGTQYAEVPKNLMIDYSSVPKSRKSANVDGYVSKSEVVNSTKDHGKARDRYKDFFGDLELEQEDNEKASEEMSCEDGLKDSEVIGKNKWDTNTAPKERVNIKKIEKVSSSEAYPRQASNLVPPLTGNGPTSNVHGTVATVKEDWVCCDKCQKWRLLPLGTNPDSLPEKWLCSMLDWLPGMNRCSISEEETTKALISRYQVPAPAPQGQTMQHGHPGGNLLGFSPADARHFDQNPQDLGLRAVSTGEKKKQGLKDVSEATNPDAATQNSDSMKKNLQASIKSKSLNCVNQSPTVNEVDFQYSGQSSSLVTEKRRHKQKERNKQLESYSSGGDTLKLKAKNKRENEDCFRSSKKMKADGIHYTDDDGTPNISGAVLKVGHSTSSDMSMDLTGKDRCKYSDHPTASKRDSKLAWITDDNEIVKKRKGNECQDAQNYTMSFPSPVNQLQVSRDFMEEISENDHKKEKKARVSKSGGKENSTSKGSARSDRKGRSVKDQKLGPDPGCILTHRGLDATDSLKKDMRSVQPSLAATSSSSKVSGSHKNKANHQDVKGSPVESVSSSPLRVSNPDKFTSTRRNLIGKDDSQGAAFFAAGSPRKCSDGEDDGGSDRSGTVRKCATSTGTRRGPLESSVLDFQDRDLGRTSGTKAKEEFVPSPEFETRHVTNGDADTVIRGAQYPCRTQNSDQFRKEEKGNDNQYHASGSRPRKSGKGSSSRSKDKSRSFRSEPDKNFSESLKESIDHTGYSEKSEAQRNKVEKNLISKKDFTGKGFGESGKRESHSKFGLRVEAVSSQDPKQNLLLDCDWERSSKRFPSEKADRLDVSGRGKSHSLPPSGRGQNETLHCSQPISRYQKENGAHILAVDPYEGDCALKAPTPIKKAENQNGNESNNSKHSIPNGKKIRGAPSPARRDSSSQAATSTVKEAKDLKHLADRLKNSGSNSESTSLYFQAALKFLHGASLLESCSGESTKHGEIIQSIQIYSSTAKLCEFCAHEYERSKDMAAAALAYKCTEVAYMRVIYSSHGNAGRDRHELQTALQIVPPGESPSSSASDIDNLNNATTVDKVALPRGVSSPQVAGNYVIAAHNRSNLVRLLSFVQDVNFAMDASRKSRIAFAAASPKLESAPHREAASSVKRALDFSFQDVEGLLRLVRVAMEAMNR
ncbi:hypothetical protein LguiA_011408 [Lonicera macranthoides]